MHTKIRNLIIICVIVAGPFTNITAQDNTLYFMHRVPQAIHTNPALMYYCWTYVELPVLSSIRYSYANTAFGYHDALHYGTGSRADSIIIDVPNLKKKLHKRNYIRNDLTLNILGAGFRISDYYFHLNVSNHLETRVGFPGGLIDLTDGNWDSAKEKPMDINLGGLGATAVNYLQIAAGVATEWTDGLYIGATAKYLMGTANVVSRRTSLMIETASDPFVLDVSSNYKINASFPITLSYDSIGLVTDVDVGSAGDNIVRDFILNKNRGFALDAGAIYKYTDQITLSASVVDLGFIRWKSNPNRLTSVGDASFRGFDLNELMDDPGQTDLVESLVDSVINVWEFTNSTDPYWTMLTTKIYLGGQYQIIPKVGFGGLVKAEFYDSRPHLSTTLSANVKPFKWLSGTLSYSIMNNKLWNLGGGFAIGGPGVQFYFVADHIPVRFVSFDGIPIPYNARTLNFQFGFNLIFGCVEEEKSGRGRPPSGRPGGRSRKKLCPAYD